MHRSVPFQEIMIGVITIQRQTAVHLAIAVAMSVQSAKLKRVVVVIVKDEGFNILLFLSKEKVGQKETSFFDVKHQKMSNKILLNDLKAV